MPSSLLLFAVADWTALAPSILRVVLPILALVAVIWVVVTFLRMRAEIVALRKQVQQLREEDGCYVVAQEIEDLALEEAQDVKGFHPVA